MSLADRRCVNYPAGTPALTRPMAEALLVQAPAWEIDAAGLQISKTFSFKSYLDGLAFVNQVAKIAEAEQHHPDITLLYKKVSLSFTTHSVKGLSDNDFICAAKVDLLVI